MKNMNEIDTKEEEALKSAKDSYFYALDILKGRFEKGENIISEDAGYSCDYARYILNDRFEKGENIISKDAKYSKLYKEYICNTEKELKKS